MHRIFYNTMTNFLRSITKPTFHVNRLLSLVSLTILLNLFAFSAYSQAANVDMVKWKAGKAAFKNNCASCHNPLVKGTGPALAGALDRWTAEGKHQGIDGKTWLYRWIKNNNEVRAAGNPRGLKIFGEYAGVAMNVFPALTDADIEAILLYSDNSAMNTEAKVEPTAGASGTTGTETDSAFPTWILVVILALLICMVFTLNRLSGSLYRLTKESQGESVHAFVPFYKNKRIIILFGILVTVFFFYLLIQNATALGRQQGYQPVQPIKFSHALHAGKHQMDCQYCHSSASKSKHANIPSVSTCMNCHKVVQKGPVYGTEEIAKIYKYADYNIDTKTYGSNPKAIEWTRIHNLPDHVFFSHAQHVKAGGVKCQTCHGPVQEMEEVYQYAPLSMGWCINCHRQTEVNFDGNKYYSIYEKYHKAKAEGKMKGVTVEDIGGTECQKCHY